MDQQPVEVESDRSLLQITLDSANLGMLNVDLTSRNVTASSVTRKHFGLRSGSELTLESLFAAIHPEDRERFRECVLWEGLAKSGRDHSLNFRTFGETPSRWLTLRGHAFRDSDGRPARYVGILADITEQKTAEISLRTAFADRDR